MGASTLKALCGAAQGWPTEVGQPWDLRKKGRTLKGFCKGFSERRSASLALFPKSARSHSMIPGEGAGSPDFGSLAEPLQGSPAPKRSIPWVARQKVGQPRVVLHNAFSVDARGYAPMSHEPGIYPLADHCALHVDLLAIHHEGGRA
jgi:hypothetical protein